jgi:hypothetical protein
MVFMVNVAIYSSRRAQIPIGELLPTGSILRLRDMDEAVKSPYFRTRDPRPFPGGPRGIEIQTRFGYGRCTSSVFDQANISESSCHQRRIGSIPKSFSVVSTFGR